MYRDHPRGYYLPLQQPPLRTPAGARRARGIMWALGGTALGTITLMSIATYYANQYFPSQPRPERPPDMTLCQTALKAVLGHCRNGH